MRIGRERYEATRVDDRRQSSVVLDVKPAFEDVDADGFLAFPFA
jgi:hypothetical protein